MSLYTLNSAANAAAALVCQDYQQLADGWSILRAMIDGRNYVHYQIMDHMLRTISNPKQGTDDEHKRTVSQIVTNTSNGMHRVLTCNSRIDVPCSTQLLGSWKTLLKELRGSIVPICQTEGCNLELYALDPVRLLDIEVEQDNLVIDLTTTHNQSQQQQQPPILSEEQIVEEVRQAETWLKTVVKNLLLSHGVQNMLHIRRAEDWEAWVDERLEWWEIQLVAHALWDLTLNCMMRGAAALPYANEQEAAEDYQEDDSWYQGPDKECGKDATALINACFVTQMKLLRLSVKCSSTPEEVHAAMMKYYPPEDVLLHRNRSQKELCAAYGGSLPPWVDHQQHASGSSSNSNSNDVVMDLDGFQSILEQKHEATEAVRVMVCNMVMTKVFCVIDIRSYERNLYDIVFVNHEPAAFKTYQLSESVCRVMQNLQEGPRVRCFLIKSCTRHSTMHSSVA